MLQPRRVVTLKPTKLLGSRKRRSSLAISLIKINYWWPSSALTLFMSWIRLTNHTDHALSAYHLTVSTNLLYWCTYLHYNSLLGLP